MLVWVVLVAAWGIDRVIKVLIQANFQPHESAEIIPGFFYLTYILNPGAAFGLLSGKTWIFIATAILVLIGVVFAQFKAPRDKWLARLALGLIGGGSLGNLYDRIVFGAVVDYADVRIWSFIFNFADVAIIAGVGCLLLFMYLEERRQRDEQEQSCA